MNRSTKPPLTSSGAANLLLASRPRHLTPPSRAGYVIALTGPWGGGKTSVANLAIRALGGSTQAVRFHRWMFSGSLDLIGLFFGELSNTLGKSEGQLREIAGKIATYAGTLSKGAGLIPGFGPVAQTTLSAAAGVASVLGQDPTLGDQRQALIDALNGYEGRIVVFLDDIDRLTDDEIRSVVRLVKLVGDLPRVTYVLAFDRERVERALEGPETDPTRARASPELGLETPAARRRRRAAPPGPTSWPPPRTLSRPPSRSDGETRWAAL